ncbi:MAG: hypothetical protein II403_04815, partial [Prevotella sp.]|nr:hypothetical protein [Prevotella sp.]
MTVAGGCTCDRQHEVFSLGVKLIVSIVFSFKLASANSKLLTSNLLNDSHLLADLDEGVDALVEVLTLVTGR